MKFNSNPLDHLFSNGTNNASDRCDEMVYFGDEGFSGKFLLIWLKMKLENCLVIDPITSFSAFTASPLEACRRELRNSCE